MLGVWEMLVTVMGSSHPSLMKFLSQAGKATQTMVHESMNRPAGSEQRSTQRALIISLTFAPYLRLHRAIGPSGHRLHSSASSSPPPECTVCKVQQAGSRPAVGSLSRHPRFSTRRLYIRLDCRTVQCLSEAEVFQKRSWHAPRSPDPVRPSATCKAQSTHSSGAAPSVFLFFEPHLRTIVPAFRLAAELSNHQGVS
jgi:hypothetical protein